MGDLTLKPGSEVAAPKPSEAEVGQALVEIEQASKAAPIQNGGAAPPSASLQQSWFSRNLPVLSFVLVALTMVATISWLAHRVAKQLQISNALQVNRTSRASGRSSTDPALQAQAEELLAGVVAGSPGAADELMAQSSRWTGKTQRTPKTDQLIGAGINLKDMHAREATLQAQLALDGVPLDQGGFEMLEGQTADRQRRQWALWSLGEIGNRGVDPVHASKIIDAYLGDPDANVRTVAVQGLALLGTDETIPMLEDRFRNDPSPAVQEQAICGVAESGMYTRAQRMVAAASLVGWVDDSTLSQQQRAWVVQALGDISGKNFGSDSTAWRSWYDSSR